MSTHPRFGLHYFPDTLHYRQANLEFWLPELINMGVSWLALQAPLERAIPETFIGGLVKAGIQPLLHFELPLGKTVDLEALRLLLRSYASWGIRHVILFDRPNLRRAWPPASWLQAELVERFLDNYLPAADLTQSYGLTPLFPPLIPGGDYWDLAFLTAALCGLKRRQPERWFDQFALAAYAGSADRPLDWGAGGAQRWPGARPYLSQAGMQDQRGLHIADWYLPLCQAELGRTLPVYLLGLGSYPGDAPRQLPGSAAPTLDENLQTERAANILESLAPAKGDTLVDRLPEAVQAGCFWLLAAEPGDEWAAQGWYRKEQSELAAAAGWAPGAIAQRARRLAGSSEMLNHQPAAKEFPQPHPPGERSIAHYVLLPLYAWGAAQWDLARLTPLLEQAHPTIGFSLEEASLASQVTVVGGNGAFSPQALNFLRQAGCRVELLDGEQHGTVVATDGT